MTAVLATPPYLAFYDLNGDPLSGGLVYTYAAGTTTPKATFTDQSATVSQANPIELDSAGRATWWIAGAYKYIIKDYLGNTIATTDNVTSFTTLAAAGAAFFQSFSGDGSTTAFTLSTDEGTDSKGLMIYVDSGQVSDIANGNFATDTIWTKGAGWTIAAGVATATGAISTAISQTATNTLVQGKSYAVTYTMTVSAGSLVPTIGGQAGTARTVAGTYSEVIVAGSTQTIGFTGAGFTGTLDNVTVTLASGTGYEIQNPNVYTINGTALTFAVAPATGTNNIFVFAPSSLLGAASSAAALAQAYAAQALASQTAAAISASSAAGYAAAKNQWTYSTTTSMANPGTGFIRFNNATLSSATAAAISTLSANSGNPDLSAWINTWDDTASSPRGTLYIFKDNGNFVLFSITGATANNTTWEQLVLTYLSGAGSFSNNDALLIGFTANGTTTVTGAGTLGLQNANAAAITGGTINGTTIGGSVPSTGRFTTITTVGTGGGAAAVIADTTNPGGSNIQLSGNGATTPNKFIRAATGVLDFLNNAYTVIMTLSDDGALSLTKSVIVGAPSGAASTGDVNIAGSYKVNGVALTTVITGTPVVFNAATTTDIIVDFTTYSAYKLILSSYFGGTSTISLSASSNSGGGYTNFSMAGFQVDNSATASNITAIPTLRSTTAQAEITFTQPIVGGSIYFNASGNGTFDNNAFVIAGASALSAAANRIRLTNSGGVSFSSGYYTLIPIAKR